jgi:hypothetical protein
MLKTGYRTAYSGRIRVEDNLPLRSCATTSVRVSPRSDTSFLLSAPCRWNWWPKYLGSRLTNRDDTHIKDAFRVSPDWRRHHGTLWHPKTLESKFSRGPPKYRLGRVLCRWTEGLVGAFSAATRSHHLVWAAMEIISHLSLEEVLRIAPRWRSLQCLHFQWISPAWLVQRVAQCNLEILETLSLEVPRTNPGTALSFNPSPPKIGLRHPFSCIAHSDHAVWPTRRSDLQLQHVHKDGYYFRCPRPMPKSCQSMGLR